MKMIENHLKMTESITDSCQGANRLKKEFSDHKQTSDT